MLKQYVPQFSGVIASVCFILILCKLTVVDKCLDKGGHFDYQNGQCLLANNEIFVDSNTNLLVTSFFFLGILIAVVTTKLIKKYFCND